MHKRLLVAAAGVAALVVGFSALGSDQYHSTIYTNDAGAGISSALCSNSGGCGGKQIAIQCDYEARYRTCEQQATCDAGANDLLLPQQPKVMDIRLSGSHRFMSIWPNDGGTVVCKIYDVQPPTLPTNP